MKKLVYYQLGFLLLTSILMGCMEETKSKKNIESVNTQILQKNNSEEKASRIKKIFYALPSPLELTLLFKKEKVNYNSEKLHKTERRKEYVLTVKKALNLGVYGADLSYSGLFGRHQAAIEYFAAAQILAEDLGMGKTFQQQFITRLEKNASNKDTLLQVVSDFFLENDSYLKDHDRQDVSTYVLAGGWIEGMFLGTQMADDSSDAQGVREIINNQKGSLHNLILLLQNVKPNKESEDLIKEIGELEVYYNQIESGEITKQEEVEGASDGVQIVMSDSSFEKIKSKVAEIRNSVIK